MRQIVFWAALKGMYRSRPGKVFIPTYSALVRQHPECWILF